MLIKVSNHGHGYDFLWVLVNCIHVHWIHTAFFVCTFSWPYMVKWHNGGIITMGSNSLFQN